MNTQRVARVLEKKKISLFQSFVFVRYNYNARNTNDLCVRREKKFTNLGSDKKTSYAYELQFIFRHILMGRQISVYIIHSKIVSLSM